MKNLLRTAARLPRVFAVTFLMIGIVAVPAEAADNDLDFFGDFRLRLEQDWDSLAGDGTKRDDRLRLRIRLRGGLDYRFSDNWSGQVAARSGPQLSQQSPHITIHDFDGGNTGPYEFNLDHWFVNYEADGFQAWVGRNELSFWHQDDLFVFDNVTYAGAGAMYRHKFGQGQLTWSGNLVALPVGMRDFSGHAFVGQLAYERKFGESALTLAGAFYGSNADPDNPAGDVLLTDNNTRDYRVFNLQMQYRSAIYNKPVTLGVDLTFNAKNYDDEPVGSFSEFHKNDVNGYVIQLQMGQSANAGDWLFGYYYAYQEALSTHSSYIQDDWVRWGDANQVRATNMKGSEFRVLYTIRPGMNIFARLFFVDAIDLLEPGDISRETGNRFRIEFNVSF